MLLLFIWFETDGDHQGCTNSGSLVTQVTKFCTVVPTFLA